jgi:hypothetical protein
MKGKYMLYLKIFSFEINEPFLIKFEYEITGYTPLKIWAYSPILHIRC